MAELITPELLARLCDNARAGYVEALCGATGQRLLATHGIATPLRVAHFLAQVCHETGGLRIVWESGDYSAERLLAVHGLHFTPAEARVYAHRPQAILNRAYANRMGNGPESSGDGWRNRGVNLMQSTGADSRRKYSAIAGVDLLAHPEMAADPVIGLKMALAEWSAHDLNRWADRGAGREPLLAISRAINCGSARSSKTPNGLADREAWLHKIARELGVEPDFAREPGELREGDSGDQVRAMQRELASLGYAVGSCDGVFGGRTRAAVLAFQDRERLPGEAGVWLGGDGGYWLAAARAHPLEPPRQAAATHAEVREAAPQAFAPLDWLRGLAGALGLGGVLGGADASLPETLAGVRRWIEPLAGDLAWAAKWWPALLIVAAVWLMALASRARARHVEAFRRVGESEGDGA